MELVATVPKICWELSAKVTVMANVMFLPSKVQAAPEKDTDTAIVPPRFLFPPHVGVTG